MESKISLYIKSHPDTWKHDFSDLDIKFKENENFIIFNYSIESDFSNDLVKESRGIILDKHDFSVACRGFDKFFNSHEQYASPIDWQSAKVLEKVDGSIIKLYWNKYDNNWDFATNGTINAKEAPCQSLYSDNFFQVIQKADNLKDIPFDSLNKNYTYIFELVGPENKVVVKYPQTSLYHIGTRDNISGKELELDLGIKKPRSFNLGNFNDCLEAIKELNKDIDLKVGSEGLLEGFVVVDKDWNRIKVKTPEYLQLHHFSNGVIYNKDKILELLKTDDVNIDEIVKNYPEYKEVFDYYSSEINRVEKEVGDFIYFTRDLFENNGNDRKDLAIRIKDNKYSNLGFKSIGNNKTARILLSELNSVQYNKLINDFKEREIEPHSSDLF